MDYFKLAQVLKPQGLKGELKCKAFTDDLSRFFDLPHVFIKKRDGFEKRLVLEARLYKQFAYLKIAGCDDIEAAEKLRNRFLYIDRQNAAKIPEGSYYIADLIGLDVVTEDGKLLGVLKNVIQTGGTDVYEVEGKSHFLFPSVSHVVLSVDLTSGKMTVDQSELGQVAVYD